MTVIDVATPYGPARAHVYPAAQAAERAVLFLGHGAGGGVDAPDLTGIARLLPDRGVRVVLVEQPYRVRGKRILSDKLELDSSFAAVVSALSSSAPVLVGGRSAGARVACRTGKSLGAVGAVALAFPLVAPSGASRANELAEAGIRVLVVQGTRDTFGGPAEISAACASPLTTVEAIQGGDHSFLVRGLERTRGKNLAAPRAAQSQSNVYEQIAERVSAFVVTALE